ncbi:hypothetical protein BCR41DRAFT_393412 [Lobosporangium transversale]|uniref:Uncharacterized protein n=1 Tax=Lobosporangium transversale TaxID=64571 RepID=A0A1Y2GX09_9FUNG|nr:hypothetical protein BCR41DRAFT_393412 [Lobosporangium transversale]ORZ26805.1 hypothetical protein BCR41DRAFT_393412 [Lobosporangium transversale]|eukprot:XP_021884568.1 hypothetical protein BCR41DRAFT_393412 [Lobosporangium transversale]
MVLFKGIHDAVHSRPSRPQVDACSFSAAICFTLASSGLKLFDGASHEHKNSEHSVAHPLRHKDNESHTSKVELGSLFKEDEQEPSRLDSNGVDSKEPLSTSASGKGADVTSSEAPAGNPFNILSSSSFETKKGPSTSHLESSILHNAFFTKPEFDSKSVSSTRSEFTAVYHVSSVTEYTSKPGSSDSYGDSKKGLKENGGKPAAGARSQKPSTLDNNEGMQKYNWTTFGSASVSRHSPSSHGNLSKEVKEKELQQMARATGLQLPTVDNKHQTPTSHRAPHKALDKAYEKLTHQSSIKPSQSHSSDASGSLNEASYSSFARHSAASIQNSPAPSPEHTNKVSKRELGPTKEREPEAAKECESEAAKEQELVADKERESETAKERELEAAKERGVDKHQGILDSTSTKSIERKEDMVHLKLAAPELKRRHDVTKPAVADSATASSTHNQPLPPVSVIQSKYLRQSSSNFVPSEHRHELSTCSSPDNPDNSEEQYFLLDETESPNSNHGSGMSGINNNNKNTDLCFKANTSTLTPSIEAYKKDIVTIGSPVPTTSTTGATVRTPASQPHEDHAYRLKPSKEATAASTANATAPKAQVTSDSSRAERGPMSVVPPAGAPAYDRHHATVHSHNERNDSRPIHSAAGPAAVSPVARAALPSAASRNMPQQNEIKTVTPTAVPPTVTIPTTTSKSDRAEPHKYQEQRQQTGSVKENDDITSAKPVSTQPKIDPTLLATPTTKPMIVGMQEAKMPSRPPAPKPLSAQTHGALYNNSEITPTPQIHEKSNFAKRSPVSASMDTAVSHNHIDSMKVPVAQLPKKEQDTKISPISSLASDNKDKDKYKGEDMNNSNAKGDLTAEKLEPVPRSVIPPQQELAVSNSAQAPITTTKSVSLPIPAPRPATMVSVAAVPAAALTPDRHGTELSRDVKKLKTNEQQHQQGQEHSNVNAQVPVNTAMPTPSPIPVLHPTTMASAAAVPAAALTPGRHDNVLTHDISKLKATEPAEQSQQHRDHSNVRAQTPVSGAKLSSSPIPAPRPIAMASIADMPAATLTSGRYGTERNHDINNSRTSKQHYP